jgi:hypothetical protein
MKVIRLTESDLEKIVKKVLEEQTIPGLSSYNPSAEAPKPLPIKYKCTTQELSSAAQFTIGQGIDPFYVRYALGILGRESDYGKMMGKFGYKAAPEYIMNKMSEMIPGFKDALQWGAKKVFRKDNWVPSMGIAQMTPDIAKKYNVNLEQLMSVSGSLYAASRYIIDLYKEVAPYFDAGQPSKIIFNQQLITNPSSTGNAALDAAIMSYNLGPIAFKKKYCKTNSPQYMAPCDSPNGIYQPFPKNKPEIKLKVDTKNSVKNYIPTLRTKTGSNQYISNTGYLKEVIEKSNNFNCIK